MSAVSVELVKKAGALLKQEHEARVRLEKEAHQSGLEKRAARIAFREVELGLCEPFKTHDEFLAKVASLMGEDLDVVEKALQRGYGASRAYGELDTSSNAQSLDPLSRWVLYGET
jgi:hypothetical protein